MRISDWSSDVCSSDLLRHREKAVIGRIEQSNHEQGRCPGDDLREDLTARSPDYRAAHAAPERLGAFLICADALEFRGFTHHFVLLARRSEEHTSELQSLMRISYAVFCLKKQKYIIPISTKTY